VYVYGNIRAEIDALSRFVGGCRNVEKHLENPFHAGAAIRGLATLVGEPIRSPFHKSFRGRCPDAGMCSEYAGLPARNLDQRAGIVPRSLQNQWHLDMLFG
jgi:hypothetical protein